MLIPHETFSLWLIISLGIHVATLALWPLPPSWTVGQPSYVVVDLRPAGGPAGDASTTVTAKAESAPKAERVTAPMPSTPKKPVTASANPKSKQTLSKSSVIPTPKVISTDLSTNIATPPEDLSFSKKSPPLTPAQTHASEDMIGGAPTNHTLGIAGGYPEGLLAGSSNNNNGLSGSGAGGIATGQGISRATPLGYGDNAPMPYPHSARRRGWEGEVLLRVDVSASGQVIAAHIEKTSEYSILDDTALQTVSGWRFRPASLNGIPRADTVLVPVHFKLHNP